MYSCTVPVVVFVMVCTSLMMMIMDNLKAVQGFYRSGKTRKSQGISVVRESQGKILFLKSHGKVRGNDFG